MHVMDKDEWQAFLRQGTRTGKFAVVLPSGRPTVTPVWFVLDDDGVLRFTTESDSAKIRAIEKEPRVALIVDQEEPPYGYVRVDAHAKIVTDPQLLRRVAGDAGARYMGAERREEFAERNGAPGEVVVELVPDKVQALADISD